MTRTVARTLLFVLAGLSPVAAQQNIYQRPTIANVIIAGSKNLYDGTYATNGTSGICGEIPKMSSLTGEGNTAVLQVSGTNEMKETVTMVVSCG